MSNRYENRNCQHVYMRPVTKITYLLIYSPACHCCFLQRFAEAKSATETGLKFICVHIHPALDSSRSEDSQLGPAGGMTSDRSEHFLFRSHVFIYYK